jgi:hypothetical protein
MLFDSTNTKPAATEEPAPGATPRSARAPGLRISDLMVLTAIAACLLAMPRLFSVGILLASPLIAPFLARRIVARRERKPAAYYFGTFAAAINVLYITSCFSPVYYAMVALCLGWAFFAIAPTFILGSVWASLATAVDAVPRRSQSFVWSVVLVLAVMPLITLWSLWPIRLLFFAARPEMERLANQAVAGHALGRAESVGLFHFASTRFDPASGDVALLSEPDSIYPTGFLWKRSGATASRAGCGMCGSNMSVYLGHGWWYLEDD